MPAPPNDRRRVHTGPGAPCELALGEGSRALCVVIHDVAPATWSDCLRLLHAVREVADIPLTWLVVPRWHGSASRSLALDAALDRLLAGGHELALHGYTHLDTAVRADRWRDRFLRGVYTEGEGEFAALDAGEARRRIELGLAWFDERGWPVHGFVAPAWLLGDGAWEAVRGYPFLYTTTWSHFHCLTPAERQSEPRESGQRQSEQREPGQHEPGPQQRGQQAPEQQEPRPRQHGQQQSGPQQSEQQEPGPQQFERQQPWQQKPDPEQSGQPHRVLSPASLAPSFPRQGGRRREPTLAAPSTHDSNAVLSPSLVYAARNRTGRIVSPRAASVLAWLMRDFPLVRLALHPRDARHPALLRHAQELIAHLLQSRVAVTKAGFARHWTGATSTAPRTRPATSANAPAPHSNADTRSAADRRAR